MAEFAKKVAEKLAVKYGLEAVRGYLIKRIEVVTPDHLYRAIKEGKHVWDVASERDKRRGRFWAKKFAKYKDKLTPKLVIDWLSEDRPDLASLLIHMGKEGGKWLAQEVEFIKAQLWSDSG